MTEKATRGVAFGRKPLNRMTVDHSSQTPHLVQLHEQEDPGLESVSKSSLPGLIPR